MKKKSVSPKMSPKERMVCDLESIFEKAMAAENFTVALKAKELLAKVHGFFDRGASMASPKPLKEWSQKELEALVAELESEPADS